MKSKPRSVLTAVCAGLLVTPLASAQSLQSVLGAGERRIQVVQESQDRIDNIVEQTRSLVAQYKQLNKEIEGLEVYNTLLERQIENQESEMQDLRTSISQVTVIQRQIVPLMTRMIDGLEQFVALDVPFLKAERTARVEELQDLMERQDVTVAEKFRKVMEAFQIENDYGRTIEAYEETLSLGDQGERLVDVLRVGRVGLYYQTPDGQVTGMWDQAAGQWVTLGSEYRNPIREGLRIAKKQVAPDLLLLPVPAPEAG